jgi:hypothetical protein
VTQLYVNTLLAIKVTLITDGICLFRRPCVVRRRSAATGILGSGFESCWEHKSSSLTFLVYFVGSVLCDELITPTVCVCVCACACVCDLGTSTMMRPRPGFGCCATEKK